MAALNEQNTRHANLCRLIMDGVELAEGQNVSVQEGANAQPLHVIGTVYPIEHVHSQYSANLQIGVLAFYQTRLNRLHTGRSELVQLKPFDIEALDQRDGSVIWVARYCTIANRNMTINQNQPIVYNLTVLALRIEDGNGVSPGRSNPVSGPVLV